MTTSKSKLSAGTEDVTTITLAPSQPVTYTWENIEVYLEISQGNCFKRLPPIQKRILDNGKSFFDIGYVVLILNSIIQNILRF